MFKKYGTPAVLAALLGLSPLLGNSPDPSDSSSDPLPWRSPGPDLFITGYSWIDFGTELALVFTVKNGGNAYSLPCDIRVEKWDGSASFIYLHSMYNGETETFWLVVPKGVVRGSVIESITVDWWDDVDESNESNNTVQVF